MSRSGGNFLERSAQQMSAKGLNRHGEMCRAENHHDDRSRKVMQPDGGAQKVQHGEYRQRHRDKEKRTTQQGDFSATHKIAEPHGVVQNQESCRKIKARLN